jgi:hypothetical protein
VYIPVEDRELKRKIDRTLDETERLIRKTDIQRDYELLSDLLRTQTRLLSLVNDINARNSRSTP